MASPRDLGKRRWLALGEMRRWETGWAWGKAVQFSDRYDGNDAALDLTIAGQIMTWELRA